MAQDNLGPWDLHLNKLGIRTTMQCYLLIFKHLSQVVLKKKIFEYFFYFFFYGLNLGPLDRSHLGSCDLHLNKVGKAPLGNAIYKISSILDK